MGSPCHSDLSCAQANLNRGRGEVNWIRFRSKYWLDIFRRRQLERELDEEINAHINLDIQHRMENGAPEAAARAAALREIRSVSAVKEATRDAWSWQALERVMQDLRYAFRMMRRTPMFSALAILVMGLGIGASTAVFSLIDAVFLKPLAFHDADRLVMIWEEATHQGVPRGDVASSNYLDWKEQSEAFEDLAAYFGNAFNLTGEGEPERLDGIQATPNLFPLLGVQPLLGRWFNAAEGLPGNLQRTILSYGLWQRRFGGNPNIVGQSIRINDQPHEVVAVMPEGFQFPRGDTQLWIPIQFPRVESGPNGRGVHFLRVIGRLKPDVTWQRAEQEVQTVAHRLSETYPATNKNYGAVVFPLRQDFVQDAQSSLWLLLAAGLLVLVIACANVANMLVTRGIGRSHEIAVRAALGASRVRVARQLIVEGLLLSIFGSIAGVSVALGTFRFLSRLVPPALAGAVAPSLDIHLLGFAVLVSVVTGITFGLVPLRQVYISHAFRGRAVSVAHSRIRPLLVSLETALAIVVIASTGLVIRTILNIGNVNPGFNPDHVLTLRLELSPVQYPTVQSRVAYYRSILDHVEAMPGIVSAGFTTFLPYTNFGGTSGLFIEGPPDPRPPQTYRREVSPNYLATIGVPLLKGRWFSEQDDSNHPPVVIISEGTAKRFDGDPIGKRVRFGTAAGPWSTVVGVVGDIREEGLQLPSQRATTYAPYAQTPSVWFFNPRDLAIHVRGEPASLVDALRREIWSINPKQTISQIRTLAAIVDEQVSDRKVQATLLSAFSLASISLAALGIYGLLSFAVESRRKEFGLRMALGAKNRDLVASVVRETLASIGAGAVVGLILATIIARSLTTLLYGVTPTDSVTLTGSVMILFAVGVLAACVPAWRATRIDPMIALRHD
jgi:predicted permease